MTCPHRIGIAAYLLDALEPPESDWLREHIAACPDCRLEYDELRGIPALLNSLTFGDLEHIMSPCQLSEDLCHKNVVLAADHRPTRTRHLRLAMSLAVALVVGLAIHKQRRKALIHA